MLEIGPAGTVGGHCALGVLRTTSVSHWPWGGVSFLGVPPSGNKDLERVSNSCSPEKFVQSLACTLALWGHSGSLVGVRRLPPRASSWSVCFLTLQLRRSRLGAAWSRVGLTKLVIGGVLHRDGENPATESAGRHCQGSLMHLGDVKSQRLTGS